MKSMRIVLSLLVLALGVGNVFAQAPVPDAGWEVFVIREGATEPPFILDNDDYVIDAIEIGTTESGQKAGLATNLINGARVDQISTLHIDRLDDVASSGSLYGPYFNIWVTDGAGHYGVIANEPSNPEWAADRWDVPDWDFLRTKVCKVYETPDAGAGTSWIHAHALLHGWSGVVSELTFEHVAGLVVSPPSAAYILDPLNAVGSGAPDELGTNTAYGYTWVFGDTAANYVTGGDGFIVDNYYATASYPVENITQGTLYGSLQPAIDAANPGDHLGISEGSLVAEAQIVIDKDLLITGAGSGTIIEPGFNTTVGSYLVSDALIYVDYGVSATIENLVIDGTGHTVRHAIQSRGADLTVRNCEIRDIHAAIYAGRGLVFLTGTGLVENCTMSNIQRIGIHIRGSIEPAAPVVAVDGLTYTGKGSGDFLDYGVEFGGGGQGTVTNSNITACVGVASTDGSTSAAIMATDYYGTGTTADVTDCTLTGNTTAFLVGYQVGDLTSASIHNCDLSGNTDSGVQSLVPGVDGTGNYWGSNDPAVVTAYAGLNVDFSPWYGLPLGSTPQEIGTNESIVEAVAMAMGGDTVLVAAGTYVESGQIVVDKTLDIVGAGAAVTLVNKAEDTGNTGSGDDRGWLLVTAGNTLNLSGLTLDGVGRQICIGILSFGAVNVSDCDLTNIGWAPGSYYGRGICLYGQTTSTMERVDFSNILRIGVFSYFDGTVTEITDCTYTGKGDGDWLDYAFEAGGGATVNVTGCTITGCTGVALVDGSASAGIYYSTFWDPGTNGTVTDCGLHGNTVGVMVGYDEFDTSDVTVVGCELSGNTDHGVYTTGPLVTAQGNWWGHASGPLDVSDDTATGGLYNPLGQGDAVSDNIDYDPWVGQALVAADPSAGGPFSCGHTEVLTFSLTTDASTPDVFMYNAVVRATGEVAFDTVTDLLPFGTVNNWFTAMDNGDGSWTITGSTVGSPTYPVTGAGTVGLFSIAFETVTDGTAAITFDSLVLRDPENATLAVALSGATIEVDCTAPLAVTDITAAPHHNKVQVGWTHDDVDVAAYWIYQGLWYNGTPGVTAYPEYDDFAAFAEPARPAGGLPDPGEGWVRVDADAVPFGVDSFFDVFAEVPEDLQRGVYAYEVYAVDAAGNVSPPAAANAHATNYWLGDITPFGGNADGFVSPLPDITALGAAFGEPAAGANYNAFCDVGPTDDWSRVGIPTTDNVINFEDLMVFSMNFGVVSDVNKTQGNTSSTARLAWVDAGDNLFALRLVDGTGVKGVHVRASLPEGTLGDVTAGELLDEQSELTFLRNIGTALDASVAVMGHDNGFTGSGDLLLVQSSVPISATALVIEVRDVDNRSLEVSLSETSGTVTPRVFALEANYPNPFNPMTKISFSLPEAQDVQLCVYGIDGTKVATLINETRAAGLHEVLWTGCNDAGQSVASGLYFYRIEAGPYSQVRKMTLMK